VTTGAFVFGPTASRLDAQAQCLLHEARAFALDVLGCPRCGGRLRVIATIEDPVAVRQILAARRPAEPLGPAPPAGALVIGN
jgi:hypothetical protein